MKKLVLFSLLSFLILSSCRYMGGRRVEGNGKIVTREQSVGKFRTVDVSGALNVYLKQDSQQSVRVETDENLQEYLDIHESDGVLYIDTRNNVNLDPSNDDIKIYVSAPEYRALHVSGASNIRGENKLSTPETFDIDLSGASGIDVDIKAPRVNAELSGASSIKLAGETKDLSIEGSGASEVKCFDLLAENTRIDVSGAFSAQVHASVQLDVEASGASEIKYKGSPSVKQSVSGASSISKAD
ncbi:MAG: DUF2807 domain-containing protein [Chitinophagaceae bacterium]|nr:MAG: DUF2807 domain-containing protein [Chitinophagaceae bacterium]